MNAPLVSIVMNCRNGTAFLEQALRSVISQSVTDWELIFWDNGSSDGSLAMAQSFADPRIRVFENPLPESLGHARSNALKQARGSFLAFHDVDDTWSPDRLERQLVFFGNERVGVVYSNFWILDSESGRLRVMSRSPLPSGSITGELLRRYPVGFLTVLIRRNVLAELEVGLDAQFDVIHDFDLMVRLSLVTEFASVDVPLATYRRHVDSETAKNVCRHSSELDRWVLNQQNSASIGQLPEFRRFRELVKYKQVCCAKQNSETGRGWRIAVGMRPSRELLKAVFVLVGSTRGGRRRSSASG